MTSTQKDIRATLDRFERVEKCLGTSNSEWRDWRA